MGDQCATWSARLMHYAEGPHGEGPVEAGDGTQALAAHHELNESVQ